jgi:hypothetical protein
MNEGGMRKSLTEFLQASGQVAPRELQDARRAQSFFGGSVLYNLVRLGILKEAEAESLFSQWSGYPYAPVRELKKIPARILAILEPMVAGRRRVIPFQRDADTLCLATSRSDNEGFFTDLEHRLGMPVIPYALMEERVEDLLERHYGIPAPRRDTVKPSVSEEPLAQPATGKEPSGDRQDAGWDPQVGLDGLPLDSDVPTPQEILATLTGGSAPGGETIGDAGEPAAPFTTGSPGPEKDDPRPVKAGEIATPLGSDPAATDPGIGRPERPRQNGMEPAAVPDSGPEAGPGTAAEKAPLERLAWAADRDEIGRAAIELAAGSDLERVALFSIQKERLVGWEAKGPVIDRERFRKLSIPLYTPSIFASFRFGTAPYVGIVPDQPANMELMAVLGGDPPKLATAFPVVLKGRPVAILYADSGPGGTRAASMTSLEELASRLALSLEILLLRRKLLS